VVGLVVELKGRQPPEEIHRLLDERQRPDVEYTPAAEWTQSVLYRCTDSRDRVASGFSAARCASPTASTTTRRTPRSGKQL
jgi:hypothetical protein